MPGRQTEIKAVYDVFESERKEVKDMPTLRHLFEELGLIGADPSDVRVPAQVYDDIVANAADSVEDETEEGK